MKTVKAGISVAWGSQGGPGTSSPERFYWAAIALDGLVAKAYGVRLDQVTGPAWMAASQGGPGYVIEAKVPLGTTKEQFRMMLQTLLSERFGLRIHHQTRSVPGFDLVVSPRGAHLKPGGTLLRDTPTFIRSDSARHAMRQMSMAQLADSLPPMIGESLGDDAAIRVRDMTGLVGTFDFTLEYSCAAGCGPPQFRPGNGAAIVTQGQPSTAASTPSNTRLPDIIAALEEQVGLKLVKVKGIPIDVIAVDRINRTPTNN